jgi:endoglucanase
VSNGIPDVLDEVKVGTDYLMKAHYTTKKLISRIGEDGDHDSFDTSPSTRQFNVRRKVYGMNDQYDSKADIAGSAAAALALMAKLYKPYDAAYAAKCLKHAEEIYLIAEANPGSTLQPGDNFYSDSTYKDSLLNGAIELYRAGSTRGASLLTLAKSIDSTLYEMNSVLDWSNTADLGRHSLAKAGYMSPYWKTDVDFYMNKVSKLQFTKGLAFFSDWGSLRSIYMYILHIIVYICVCIINMYMYI